MSLTKLQDALNNTSLLDVYISEELASRVSVECGYNFPDERIKRIAEDARTIMAELKCGAPFALGEAFEVDILMYGDPDVKREFVGILE